MSDTVRHAESGTAGWREAARAIHSAQLDHGAMYQLGAQLSETLRAIEQVARSLDGQVARYGKGRSLRDDEGGDPVERVRVAAWGLHDVILGLSRATEGANQFWSAIGHIGLADTTNTEG